MYDTQSHTHQQADQARHTRNYLAEPTGGSGLALWIGVAGVAVLIGFLALVGGGSDTGETLAPPPAVESAPAPAEEAVPGTTPGAEPSTSGAEPATPIPAVPVE